MENLINIYELIDPRNSQPRYIGQTKNTLPERFKCHISNAKNNTIKTHTCDWIKSLLNIGAKPIIKLIDEVSVKEWQFWERHYISLYRSWGFDLTNLTDGGEGLCNLSQEIKDKISKSKIGKKHTKEHNIKIGLGGIGKIASKATLLKRSESMKLAYKEGRKKPETNARRWYAKSIIVCDINGSILDKFDQMIDLINNVKYKSFGIFRGGVYSSIRKNRPYKNLIFKYGTKHN